MTRQATLPFADLESIYDEIATAIDRAGPDRQSLFLAKLALTLSHFVGRRDRVAEAIEIALRDIDSGGDAAPGS